MPPDYVYIELSDCAACVLIPNFDPITGEPVASTSYEYSEVMAPGTVYVIGCDSPMETLTLPSPDLQPVLQGVAVISECRIQQRNYLMRSQQNLKTSYKATV